MLARFVQNIANQTTYLLHGIGRKCSRPLKLANHVETGRNDATGRCRNVRTVGGISRAQVYQKLDWLRSLIRRQVQCQYSQKSEERGMVESLEQKLKSLERSVRLIENAFADQQCQLLPDQFDRGIQYQVSYPVSKRWYFPMLLNFSQFSFAKSCFGSVVNSDIKDSTLWSQPPKT